MAKWLARNLWYPMFGMSLEAGISEIDECMGEMVAHAERIGKMADRAKSMKEQNIGNKAKFVMFFKQQKRLEKEQQLIQNNIEALSNLRTHLHTAQTVETIQEVLKNISPALDRLKGANGGTVDVQKMLLNFQHTTTKFQMTVDTMQENIGDSADSDMDTLAERDFLNHARAYKEAMEGLESNSNSSTSRSDGVMDRLAF